MSGSSVQNRMAILLCGSLAFTASRVLAEQGPGTDAVTAPVESNVSTTVGGSGDYRPIGTNLFPLYWQYAEGGTDYTHAFFYLYNRSQNQRGDTSLFLFPILNQVHETSPAADSLALYPLLFFHRRGEDTSYTFSLPLYYEAVRHGDPGSFFRLVVPFWLQTRKGDLARYHVVPPFFRYSRDETKPEAPVVSSRLGLWHLLELWESRVSPGESRKTAFNLLNFKEETLGGLSLYRHTWEREGEAQVSRTYLFPLYWHSAGAGSSLRVVLPLFAHSSSFGQSDLWILPILSRIGSGDAGESRIDVLAPLFATRSDGTKSHTHLFPLYLGNRDEKSWEHCLFPFVSLAENRDPSPFRALGVAYHHAWNTEDGSWSRSVLFPLSYVSRQPAKSSGTTWIVPYLERFDDKKLWRLGIPLYYEYQALAGGETDWFFRLGLPTFVSSGTPTDYFAVGFPLYWGFRDGYSGFHLFLPLFLHHYSGRTESLAVRGTYLFPFFAHVSRPTRKVLSILGPLYIQKQFYDWKRQSTGSGHHFLWPLVGVENRNDGHLYRFLPFFWQSAEGDTKDMLVLPFYYESDGPKGKHRYFFPAYGRYETETLSRQFFALGTYIRTRETMAEGKERARDDVLWSLFSSERDEARDSRHLHILPLGYWNTQTPLEDRSIAGPLYYSHRITEGDTTHRLNLVLGNLFLGKVVERRAAPTAPATTRPAPAASDGIVEQVPADDVTPEPTLAGPVPATGSSGPVTEIWRDEGVLWPIARKFRSSDGDRGTWLIPFFFDLEDEQRRYLTVLPFYFRHAAEGSYAPSYFRYFFAFDKETWQGGDRWTLGWILADWMTEQSLDHRRLRILYPIFQSSRNREGYSVDITPLCRFSAKGNVVKNWLFPFYWEGQESTDAREGEPSEESRYFFLFPFYGYHERPTHVDRYALFRLLHLRTAPDALRFELWPIFFWTDEPGLLAVRGWPLHADETGLTAGSSWVTKFFFLSKRFDTGNGYEYRLDPFLFRISDKTGEGGRSAFRVGGLLELFAYEREADRWSLRAGPLGLKSTDQVSAVRLWPLHAYETGPEAGSSALSKWLFLSKRFDRPDGYSYRLDPFLFHTSKKVDAQGKEESSVGGLFGLVRHDRDSEGSSFRALPLALGWSNERESRAFLFPLYYRRARADGDISYFDPWRFIFLANRLEGSSGERHTSVLWKLFEHTDNPRQPDRSELGLLFRVFYRFQSPTASSLHVLPFFQYYRRSDEEAEEVEYSFLLSLYRYQRINGLVTHTILYGIRF